MKILTAQQIRKIDLLTIEREPISSINLMERASNRFTDWFINKYPDTDHKVYIFCGTGNNGGDGLAVARLLHQKFYDVVLFVCKINSEGSPDFTANLKRLPSKSELPYFTLNGDTPFPVIENGIIIDAIFGSGLNRPVAKNWVALFNHLNIQKTPIVSIDIPSGVFADQATEEPSIKATHTLSFELPKLAFVLPENEARIGTWETVSINLQKTAIAENTTNNFYVTENFIKKQINSRSKFDHKGNFGHALIIGGSKGKIGAALLATKACLRSGAGLVTSLVPECGYQILQQEAPEAMTLTSDADLITKFEIDPTFNVIGIGPGLGTDPKTKEAFVEFINSTEVPLVVDADALNIMAQNRELLKLLPKNSILTPHPGEFRRIFGEYKNDFQRLEAQRDIARDLQCYLILKGAHTCLATPEGDCYFNSTGNPGMATGGSGDVLTGILTGLMAQGYNSKIAALLGVYVHGLAGDLAIKNGESTESLIAGDLIYQLGQAFNLLK